MEVLGGPEESLSDVLSKLFRCLIPFEWAAERPGQALTCPEERAKALRSSVAKGRQ
jgi:hypothetical protein